MDTRLATPVASANQSPSSLTVSGGVSDPYSFLFGPMTPTQNWSDNWMDWKKNPILSDAGQVLNSDYLSKTVLGIIVIDNDWHFKLIPWQETDKQEFWVTTMEFLGGVAPVPYEGTSRETSERQEQEKKRLIRYGIGSHFEDGFSATAEGQARFKLKLKHMASQCLERGRSDIIDTLRSCQTVARILELRTSLVKNKNITAWAQEEVSSFCCLNFQRQNAKGSDLFANLVSRTKLTIPTYNGAELPDSLIVPTGTALHLNTFNGRSTYETGGALGVQKYEMGANVENRRMTYQGLDVFETRPYNYQDLEGPKSAPNRLLTLREIGEFYEMETVLKSNDKNFVNYEKKWLDTYIYNQNSDVDEKINFWDAVEHSRVWNLEGDGYSQDVLNYVSKMKSSGKNPFNGTGYNPSDPKYCPFFITADGNNQPTPAKLWGQMPPTATTEEDWKMMARSLIGSFGRSVGGAYEEGYSALMRLVEGIESQTPSEDWFKAVIAANHSNSTVVDVSGSLAFGGEATPDDLKATWGYATTQWKSNPWGGLRLPEAWPEIESIVYPPGYANVPGIRTIAHEGRTNARWTHLVKDAEAALAFLDGLSSFLQKALPSCRGNHPSYREPWFFKADPTTTLFSLLTKSSDPIFLPYKPSAKSSPDGQTNSASDLKGSSGFKLPYYLFVNIQPNSDAATIQNAIRTAYEEIVVNEEMPSGSYLGGPTVTLRNPITGKDEKLDFASTDSFEFMKSLIQVPSYIDALKYFDQTTYNLVTEFYGKVGAVISADTTPEDVAKKYSAAIKAFGVAVQAEASGNTKPESDRLLKARKFARGVVASFDAKPEQTITALGLFASKSSKTVKEATVDTMVAASIDDTGIGGPQPYPFDYYGKFVINASSSPVSSTPPSTQFKQLGAGLRVLSNYVKFDHNDTVSSVVEKVRFSPPEGKHVVFRTTEILEGMEAVLKTSPTSGSETVGSFLSRSVPQVQQKGKISISAPIRFSSATTPPTGAFATLATAWTSLFGGSDNAGILFIRTPLTMSIEYLKWWKSYGLTHSPLFIPSDPSTNHIQPLALTQSAIPDSVYQRHAYATINAGPRSIRNTSARKIDEISFISSFATRNSSSQRKTGLKSKVIRVEGSNRKSAKWWDDTEDMTTVMEHEEPSQFDLLNKKRNPTVISSEEDLYSSVVKAAIAEGLGEGLTDRFFHEEFADSDLTFGDLRTKMFSENWRRATSIEDPLLRLAASAIALSRCDSLKYVKAMYNSDIHPPFRVRLWRLFMNYIVGTGIMLKSGPSTGNIYIAYPNLQIGRQTSNKTFKAHFTYESGVVISNRRNVTFLMDISSHGYVGGANCEFMATGEEAKMNDQAKPSLLSTVISLAEQKPSLMCMFTGDITQSPSFNIDIKKGEYSYSTAEFYKVVYPYIAANVRDPFDPREILQVTGSCNAAAFQGKQYLFNPFVNHYNTKVECKGHRKDACHTHCAVVWNGRASVFPEEVDNPYDRT